MTPPQVEARPKARNGLPIPYANESASGAEDFAVIQGDKLLTIIKHRLCGVCGQPLGYWIAFLGGPRCVTSRAYADPPMHEDCAEASTRLCPHIAKWPTSRSQKVAQRGDVFTPAGFSEAKPSEWVMYITRGFGYDEARSFFIPAPAKRLRRFVYGADGNLREGGAAAHE